MITISACGAGLEEDGRFEGEAVVEWRVAGKGDGATCEAAGLSADALWSQFAYARHGSGRGGYQAAATWGPAPRLASGDEASMTVYLLDGRRAIVEYRELHGAGAEREVRNETVVVTRASVDPTGRLTIDGVGAGTPTQYTSDGGQCTPAFAFSFSDDLRTAGLRGRAATIVPIWTSAYVIDPDHLADVPSATARRWFEEDVASGKIVVIRR